MTRAREPKRCTSSANLPLSSVPPVASTPMTPARVASAAGFTAGSMPTMGRP